MRLNLLSLFALVSVSALCQARLQPQVRRHVELTRRADLQDDDCNQGGNLPRDEPHVKGYHQYEDPNRIKGHHKAVSVGGRRGNPTPGSDGLLAHNKYHPDFILGVAIHAEYLKNPVLTQCIRDNFNLLVPEYEAKSAAIHQQEESWQFEATDAILKFTQDNNMQFKIHTLFFDQTMAPYFEQYRGNATALEGAMTKHIDGMMQRYGDKTLIVDVVNEIMAYDGSGNMKGDIFYNTLKDDYLPFVFNAVRKASPHPILSLNDNDIEGQHAKGLKDKYSGFMKMLKHEQDRKTPIQAVGLECHFEVGKVPQDLEYVIGQLVAKGVQVMITELDLKNDQNDIEQQAKDFATVTAACLKYAPHCKGVIFWGLTDHLDWLGDGAHSTLFADGCKDKGVTGPVKKVLQSGSY